MAYDLVRDKPSVGPLHYRVLRLISQGTRHTKSIHAALAGEGNARDILAGLAARGYVVQGRGGVFCLTDKGIGTLPRREPARWETSQYVAQTRAPRRPGSDHAHLPSLAGSQFLTYAPHV